MPSPSACEELSAPFEKEAGAAVAVRPILGVRQLITLGVGATLGAGLFSITGIAAGQCSGAAVSLSFIFAAFACSLIGLCYAELASMFPNASGSAYAYASEGLGKFVAWVLVWCLVASYLCCIATVASSWSSYLASLLGEWGINLDLRFWKSTGTLIPLADGHSVRAFGNFPAMIGMFLVSFLLLRGSQESAWINSLIVSLKVGIIAIVVICCFKGIQPANYHPFIPENTGNFGDFGWSGVARGAVLVFFSFIGFDIVASAARETKNPQRTLPIAILGTLFAITFISVVFSIALLGVVNYQLLSHDASPVGTAMNLLHLPLIGAVVKIGVLIGFIAGLYGLLYGQIRVVQHVAEDGLIPQIFAKLNPKHVPAPALLFLTILITILAVSLPVPFLGSMTSVGIILAFLLVCASVIALRIKRPDAERPFKVFAGTYLVPGSAILVCFGGLMTVAPTCWLYLSIWIFLGIMVYVFYGRKQLPH
ncbi:amino acid permease [Acetobacteraceae bacterium]|nr:amino acid permease [Acetobacteraceae bacterium]